MSLWNISFLKSQYGQNEYETSKLEFSISNENVGYLDNVCRIRKKVCNLDGTCGKCLRQVFLLTTRR